MAKDISKGEIIIYKTKKGPELEVRLGKETIWLTQKQIAELFDVNVPAVSKHINNIYKEGELSRKLTVSKMETVQKEGDRFIKRVVELFDLDIIISVGYRVNSRKATQFRIWATKTLKSYLIEGYAVNEKRLLQAERKINDNALVALALLIAVSDPGEKDVMIKIITNILS